MGWNIPTYGSTSGWDYTNRVAQALNDLDDVISSMYSGVPLYGVGNSYMDNLGFFGSLAGQFGFQPVTNKATGGYRMQDTAITLNSPAGGSYVWTPGSRGVVVVNDLGNNLRDGDNAANRGAALHSARTVAALLSSRTKLESPEGATFNYGFDWIGPLDNEWASGGSFNAVNFDTAYVDINVPQGDSAVVFYGGDGETFRSGVFTLTSNGETLAVLDLDYVAKKTPYVSQHGTGPAIAILRNMVEGQVVRATYTTEGRPGNVIACVDSLLPLSLNPPKIVWLKPVDVLAPEYSNPTMLEYLRTIPDLVADEFPNVTVVDPLPGWDKATMLGPDQLHPNDKGNAHLLKVVSGGLIRA